MQLFIPCCLWLLPAAVLTCALFSEEFITPAKAFVLLKCSSYVHDVVFSYFISCFFGKLVIRRCPSSPHKCWPWQTQLSLGKTWMITDQWTMQKPPSSIQTQIPLGFPLRVLDEAIRLDQGRSRGRCVLHIILGYIKIWSCCSLKILTPSDGGRCCLSTGPLLSPPAGTLQPQLQKSWGNGDHFDNLVSNRGGGKPPAAQGTKLQKQLLKWYQ